MPLQRGNSKPENNDLVLKPWSPSMLQWNFVLHHHSRSMSGSDTKRANWRVQARYAGLRMALVALAWIGAAACLPALPQPKSTSGMRCQGSVSGNSKVLLASSTRAS